MYPYPEHNTPEYEWFAKGAKRAAELDIKGMSDSGRQVYEAVQVMAQNGDSEQALTMSVTYIWGPTLRFRQRWWLAWQLVRPRRARR